MGRLPAVLSERGQSAVMVAVVMVVLVGFLALAIDVGNMYAQRRSMQNAADAGALAGARAMALGKDGRAAAVQYAQTRNGAEATQTTISGSTITVTVSKRCATYFASVIGIPDYTVRASAQANYSAPSSWSGSDLVPIAVYKDAIRNEPEKSLIWDSDTTSDAPKNPDDYPIGWEQGKDNLLHGANRGWLDLDNDGSLGESQLEGWIHYGFTERLIQVGDWIQGDPGSRSSALQAVDAYRTGTIVICPVYDAIEYIGGNKAKFRICGFAAFQVTDVRWKGSFKYVLGYFKYYVATEDQHGGGSTPTGTWVVDLLR